MDVFHDDHTHTLSPGGMIGAARGAHSFVTRTATRSAEILYARNVAPGVFPHFRDFARNRNSREPPMRKIPADRSIRPATLRVNLVIARTRACVRAQSSQHSRTYRVDSFDDGFVRRNKRINGKSRSPICPPLCFRLVSRKCEKTPRRASGERALALRFTLYDLSLSLSRIRHNSAL